MKESKKKLTVSQWKQIEEKYKSGDSTIVDLAEEYRTPYRTIQDYLNKRGIQKGTSAGAIKPPAMTTAENYHIKSKEIVCKLTDAICEAVDEITPGPGRAAQICRLATAASKLFSSAEKVGLISEDENLPILQVIELTAEDIAEMRRRQIEDAKEASLNQEPEDSPRDYEAEGIVIEGPPDDDAETS